MGICPSRCGERQPSPEAEPAVTDAAMETKPSPSLYDPNHSLKRFLHLNQDRKTSAIATPRTSLVKSTPIPHSSELFSLPLSELELRSSFALSPTETPRRRAPKDGALMSSHFTLKSPSKGRNKRIRPATRGAAHQRLVDAIVRLERLSDAGKATVSGFRGSDDVASKSSFGDCLSKPVVRSRHVHHYQLPLPKPTRAPARARAPFSHPAMGNPVSLDSTPADTDFLRETFVSLIAQPRKHEHPKVTVPVPATATNRCRFEEIDGEEMFSFEFGPSEDRARLKQPPVRKKSVSLQRLLQSGAQGSSCRGFGGDEVAMARAELETKSSCSTWQPIEVFVEQSGMDDKTAKARDSGESGMKSSREEESDVAARPAQDRNLLTMRKAKSPRLALRLKALKGLRRRRLSQSLDSIESSVIHVDLDTLRNQGAKPIAGSRLLTVDSPEKHASEAISIDAKRVEFESLPVWSRLELPACEQKQILKENCGTGISDTSTTTEFADAEILPPQEIVSLVEDPIPSTGSAESSPREPAGNLDKVPETKDMRSFEERLPSERTECTASEPTPILSKVLLHFNLGGSPWFGLVETFRSLLRLLFFFVTEQTGAECKIDAKLTTATTGPDEEIQHE